MKKKENEDGDVELEGEKEYGKPSEKALHTILHHQITPTKPLLQVPL